MNRTIIAQIEATLRLKDSLLCSAIINATTLFPFVPVEKEERSLRALTRGLLRSGLSPVQVACHIRDARRRICLFVLQGPVDLRGAAWFGKGGLHRRLMGTRRSRRNPSRSGIPGTGAV